MSKFLLAPNCWAFKVAGTMLGHAALHNQPFPGRKSTFTLPGLLTAHSCICYNMANCMSWTKWRMAWDKHTPGSERQGGAPVDSQVGNEFNLLFLQHSMHICSGNIAKEIQKPFCSSDAQSRPETKKQRYRSSATKQRAALALGGVISPFSEGWSRETFMIPTWGFWQGARRRTSHCRTTHKVKNALKGVLIMFFTLLCWLNGSTEHLFPAIRPLMENRLAAAEVRFPLPESSPRTTPVLDCRLHRSQCFACNHWQ